MAFGTKGRSKVLACALLATCTVVAVTGVAHATGGGDAKSKRSSGEPGPRVVEPSDRRNFYRGGWRTLIGRRIHLHVEAEVVRHAPENESKKGSKSPRLLRFNNRSVALLIDSGSPEWRKAQQDLNDTAEYCVHGIVRLAPTGARAPAQLEVDSIKRAPGSRR